jgi:hypothetical protein
MSCTHTHKSKVFFFAESFSRKKKISLNKLRGLINHISTSCCSSCSLFVFVFFSFFFFFFFLSFYPEMTFSRMEAAMEDAFVEWVKTR